MKADAMLRVKRTFPLFTGRPILVALLLGMMGCAVRHAAPPPIMILGGTHTAPMKGFLLGGGVGLGVEDFPDEKSWGGSGWYGSGRYGLKESLDLGLDVVAFDGLDILLGKSPCTRRSPETSALTWVWERPTTETIGALGPT